MGRIRRWRYRRPICDHMVIAGRIDGQLVAVDLNFRISEVDLAKVQSPGSHISQDLERAIRGKSRIEIQDGFSGRTVHDRLYLGPAALDQAALVQVDHAEPEKADLAI